MPEDYEYESGHKTPREKQQQVLTALARVGRAGLTSREFAKIMTPGDESAVNGWGSAFSVLHKQEHLIVALAERREDHHVYVMPEYIDDRLTWPGYEHKGTGAPWVIVREIHCKTCTCNQEN